MAEDTQKLLGKDPMQEFQDRIVGELKDKMGAMLPEEALTGLVQRAVDEQFFKPRPTHWDYNGRADAFGPSWFVAEVVKVAQPVLNELVVKYVADNRAQLEEGMKVFLEDKNLLLLAFAQMQMATMPMMAEFARLTAQSIKNGY